MNTLRDFDFYDFSKDEAEFELDPLYSYWCLEVQAGDAREDCKLEYVDYFQSFLDDDATFRWLCVDAEDLLQVIDRLKENYDEADPDADLRYFFVKRTMNKGEFFSVEVFQAGYINNRGLMYFVPRCDK